MIEVKNLYLNYIKEYSALFNINLRVEDGEKIALVGDNDSGRTSLIRCLCGLEKFKNGEVYINKINLKKVDFKKDVNLIYLSSSPVFFNNKTVHHNLAYPLKIRGFSENVINQKINRALECLGIESLKEKKIKTLSNDEKTVVNIARSLLRDADIYLIDDIFKFNKLTNEKIATIFANYLNKDASVIFALNSSEEYLKDVLNVSKVYYMTNGSLTN